MKKKTITPLSIEDEMKQLSEEIVSKRADIKAQSEVLKEKEETLKAYMMAKGLSACGSMTLEEVAGTLQWVSDLKGKKLDMALGRVQAAIDKKYLLIDIDKKAVFANIKNDYALVGLLKTEGIDIAQKESSTRLKEAK